MIKIKYKDLRLICQHGSRLNKSTKLFIQYIPGAEHVLQMGMHCKLKVGDHIYKNIAYSLTGKCTSELTEPVTYIVRAGDLDEFTNSDVFTPEQGGWCSLNYVDQAEIPKRRNKAAHTASAIMLGTTPVLATCMAEPLVPPLPCHNEELDMRYDEESEQISFQVFNIVFTLIPQTFGDAAEYIKIRTAKDKKFKVTNPDITTYLGENNMPSRANPEATYDATQAAGSVPLLPTLSDMDPSAHTPAEPGTVPPVTPPAPAPIANALPLPGSPAPTPAPVTPPAPVPEVVAGDTTSPVGSEQPVSVEVVTPPAPAPAPEQPTEIVIEATPEDVSENSDPVEGGDPEPAAPEEPAEKKKRKPSKAATQKKRDALEELGYKVFSDEEWAEHNAEELPDLTMAGAVHESLTERMVALLKELDQVKEHLVADAEAKCAELSDKEIIQRAAGLMLAQAGAAE